MTATKTIWLLYEPYGGPNIAAYTSKEHAEAARETAGGDYGNNLHIEDLELDPDKLPDWVTE